jgi:Protein of unknown function (DUF1501)
MPKANPARSRRPAPCWPVIVLAGLVGTIGVGPGPARVEAGDTSTASSWAFRPPRRSKLAGGGIKGGQVIGATDEFGLRAVEDPVHVNDLHATILRLLGLDHRELTYLFEGRDQRLTDVGGDREFADRLLT